MRVAWGKKERVRGGERGGGLGREEVEQRGERRWPEEDTDRMGRGGGPSRRKVLIWLLSHVAAHLVSL